MTSVTDRAAHLAANAAPDHAVPDSFVAPLRRDAAAWGGQRATELLAEPHAPLIKFFKPARATGNVVGSAAVGAPAVFVAWDLPPGATAGVAAHEVAHSFGIVDEAKCEAIQAQVSLEWQAARYAQRAVLAKRWNEQRDRWFSMPASPQRVAHLCEWMGVQPFQGALAVKELELRCNELEEIGRNAPAGQVAHLVSPRRDPPPALHWSFSRGVSR